MSKTLWFIAAISITLIESSLASAQVYDGDSTLALGNTRMSVDEKTRALTQFMIDYEPAFREYNNGFIHPTTHQLTGGPKQGECGQGVECSIEELRSKGYYVCDNSNEQPYLCDSQTLIFCTDGKLKDSDGVDEYRNVRAKARGHQKGQIKDPALAGCDYSDLPIKKRDVAPEIFKGDMNACAFTSGFSKVAPVQSTCQFARKYPNSEFPKPITSLKEIKAYLEDARKNRHYIAPADESGAYTRLKWKNLGTSVAGGFYWSTDTQKIECMPGNPLCSKAAPPPPPPKKEEPPQAQEPTDSCDQAWGANSDCTEWKNCRERITKVKLKLCTSCQIQDCAAGYETVASDFSGLADKATCMQTLKDTGIDIEDVKARAQDAAQNIQYFREAIAGKPGFYATDYDKCFFARFLDARGAGVPVGSKPLHVSDTCDSSRAIGLNDLEDKLTAIANQDAIAKAPRDTLRKVFAPVFSQVTDLANYMQNRFDAKSGSNSQVTQMMLQGVASDPNSALFKATQGMVKSLYKLQYSDNVIPFDQLISNPKYGNFFKCNKETVPKDSLQVSKAVINFNKAWIQDRNHHECILAPDGSDTVEAIFEKDLGVERSLSKVDRRCNPPKDSSDFPTAGTDKYNTGALK